MTNQPRKKGRLTVIHGSMFGGKTEHMIALLRRARADGRRVVAFKHEIDNRYDPTHLVTHTQDRFDARRVPGPDAILQHCDDADCVAIDEGHFFKNELVPVVEALLARGIDVVVAGITNDAWGNPFEPMPKLCQMANDVVEKQSPCRVCGKPSPYTQRITRVNDLHMVGGTDDYEPRCPEHFQPLTGPIGKE